jgi:microcompartment protein CcmK/EutM
MQIARVVGTVVSTQKNRKLEGAKLLLVQPLGLDDQPRGIALLAIDSVGAGVGEKVLVVIEGKAAGDALGRKAAAVDAAIVGIVDAIDYREDAHAIQ